ncbi:MAG: class I SAM-dependent methyltransferase [Thermoplasmatota archaeon]
MAGVQSTEIQRAQSEWFREWQRYILRTYCNDCASGLDVGCGSGAVMENLSDMFDLEGLDLDPSEVEKARAKGLEVSVGDAMKLPFGDRSFDLVYSSFLFIWNPDITGLLKEMIRVAGKKVVILGEPIWNRSIVHPPEMHSLIETERDMIRRDGGDPEAGLDVLDVISGMGLKHRFGLIPVDTSPEEMRRWVSIEREYASQHGAPQEDLPLTIFYIPIVWAVIDLSG